MSKQRSMFERSFNAAVLILGTVILLSLALEMLAGIWGWLLLIAALIGVTIMLARWLRNRGDRW